MLIALASPSCKVGNCGKYMLTGKNVNKTEGFYN